VGSATTAEEPSLIAVSMGVDEDMHACERIDDYKVTKLFTITTIMTSRLKIWLNCTDIIGIFRCEILSSPIRVTNHFETTLVTRSTFETLIC
jgi:hypothetical protein